MESGNELELAHGRSKQFEIFRGTKLLWNPVKASLPIKPSVAVTVT